MHSMFYIKSDDFTKDATVDTTNLTPEELLHMNFTFYNVTFIVGFTSILDAVCERITIICILPTVPKQASVRIIIFILATLNN